jgi:hypothetical protein
MSYWLQRAMHGKMWRFKKEKGSLTTYYLDNFKNGSPNKYEKKNLKNRKIL